jgi:hypothetical protein
MHDQINSRIDGRAGWKGLGGREKFIEKRKLLTQLVFFAKIFKLLLCTCIFLLKILE